MIQLRNPIFGNTFSIVNYSEVRHTLNMDLKVVRPPEWPYSTLTTVTIEGLSKAKRDEFFQYAKDNVAQFIEYLDHNGANWIALIVGDIVSYCKGRGCQYTLEFTIEGTPN